MRRPLCLSLLAALLTATASSCCCSPLWEQPFWWAQYNHSVRRMTIDYNSYLTPTIAFEQVDHLPYPAAQVGYYRWMYDKDPGHQMAALGPVPTPTTVVPQCVPPGDNPFEYQVAFPNAIPGQTDALWTEGQPEPINVPRAQPGDASKPLPPTTGKELAPGMLTVPMAPVLPPAATDKRTVPAPTAAPAMRSRPAPSVEHPGAPLPSFDGAVPPPKPVDEEVPPMLGPGSQENPNVRLTTGAPQMLPAPTAAQSGLWPR